MPRVTLDTNILIYSVDPSQGDRSVRALQIVRAAGEGEAVLTQQVLGEFLNVSRRMPHLDQQRLRRIAWGLGATFPLITTSKDALFEAFDRAGRFRLQFWDAVILTVCVAHAVTHLISEDLQDGAELDGVRIVNPFAAANRSMLDGLLAIDV